MERGNEGRGEEENGGNGDWRNGRKGDFHYICSTRCKNIIMELIRTHKELKVYQLAFRLSMEIFNLTKSFPKEEVYSLVTQIRKSSRSVSANLAEAFRKRRYEKAFISKLSDCEAEAAETQVWLEYSFECGYLSKDSYERLYSEYYKIIGKLVVMIRYPEKWSQSH